MSKEKPTDDPRQQTDWKSTKQTDQPWKGPVEKVMHAVPVFFKGSGFYSTDYGRGSKRRDNTDGSAEPSKAKSDAHSCSR